MKLVDVIAALVFIGLCSGCVTKHPGGRSDLWKTTSFAQDDVVYYGFGVTF